MKLFEILKSKKISYLILFFIIGCCIFNIFIFSYEMDSADVYDFLEDIVWAKATLDSKSLISNSFYYPYLIPFGPNILMSIFVSIFGPSLFANQCGMITYLIVYFLSILYLSNSIFDDKLKRNYFISISTLFVFTYAGENLFHHILYYGIALVCLLGELGAVINIVKGKNITTNFIILGICCFFGSVNSSSVAVLSNLVVIIGIVIFSIYLLFKKEFILYKKQLILLLIVILSITMVGIISFKIIENSSKSMMLQEDRLLFGDAERVTRNLVQFTIRDFLNLFYLNSMVSMDAIGIVYYMGKLSFLLLTFVISIVAIKDLINNNVKYNNELILLLMCYAIVFVISFAFHTFSVTSNQRYLFLALIAMFGVSAVYVTTKIDNERITIIVNSLLIVYLCFYSIVLTRLYLVGQNKKNYYNEVIEVLNDNDVAYGFAEIDYSVPIYVLSSGNIDSIYISNDRIYYFNFDINKLNKKDNYDSFFVLIPTMSIDNYSIDLFENNKINKIEKDEYVLYIFDINDWDSIYNRIK